MNIISNNCLGGYIYKYLLNTKYMNPFIWTLFKNPDDFIKLIENYNYINFENISISKDNEGLNDYYINIDDKFKINFVHIYFDDRFPNPLLYGENIYTNNPKCYIESKYIERLKRMKTTNITKFIYFEPNLKCTRLKELPVISKSKKIHTLIFTNEKLEDNEYTKVLPSNELDLPYKICNFYKNEIMEFLNENCNNND